MDKIGKLKVSTDALLVTCDVKSLYTNIQSQKGLKALERVYRKSELSMPFEEIKRLLEISLTHNDFEFNGQWYLQVSGTAMGKKYAPNYANIFMADFEQEIMSKAEHKPTMYLRYLDDIYMVWEKSREELDQFIHLFNTQDDSIKIVTVISETSVDFLDVTVFKGNRFKHHNILDTKVYFKPTDTHELLDRHSFHPSHTFDGLVKSQLIRFLKICNNMEDFHTACSALFKALKERRHYSARCLRRIKADFLARYHQLGQTNDPKGVSLKCGHIPCQCCLYLEPTSYIAFGQLDCPIFGRLDCQSCNIIYLIECRKCSIRYVGETQRSLATRLYGHLSDINLYKDKPVANHFNYECYPSTDNLMVYPIEFIPEQGSIVKNKAKRLIREAHWMRFLGTQQPWGLNLKLRVKRDIVVCLPFNQVSRLAHTLFRQTFQLINSALPGRLSGDLICAFKRNKNLGDYLVSTKLK